MNASPTAITSPTLEALSMMNFSNHLRFALTGAAFWMCVLPAYLIATEDAAKNEYAQVFAGDVNLSEWRKIPVYHQGRPQPIDTFANRAKKVMCDREKAGVWLNLADYVEVEKGEKKIDVAGSEYAAALPLFPDNGGSVKWSSSEMLLSWLVEPEKWEVTPFILAQHEELREIIGVPTFNKRGGRLKYVSPAQIARSEGFTKYLKELSEKEVEARRNDEKYEKTSLDELVEDVRQAYSLYRSITFDATAPLTHTPLMQHGSRSQFVKRFHSIAEVALAAGEKKRKLYEMLQILSEAPNEDLRSGATGMLRALARVSGVGQPLDDQYAAAIRPESANATPEPVSLEDAAAAVIELRSAAEALDEVMQREKDRIYDTAAYDKEAAEKLGPMFRDMRFKAGEIKRLSMEMHTALYDENNGLRLIPAMNPAALDKDRVDTGESQPWLNLQAILHASTAEGGLLEPFPKKQILAVRRAWNALARAYVDRDDEKRAKKCADAQLKLSAALRNLGVSMEDERLAMAAEELPEGKFDIATIKHTAYPPVSRMVAEVRYNTVQPFRLCWVACFLALAAFSVSAGPYFKRTAFWTGAGILFLTVLWTIYAFYLRVAITRWAPVTNMWETVVFVPFVIISLGLWFMVLPAIWPGIRDAWRVTAIPFSWEATKLTPEQEKKMPSQAWTFAGLVMLLGRLAGMAFFVWLLMIAPYADGGNPIFRILPQFGHLESGMSGVLGAADKIFVWGMGLLCVALSTWFLPRVIMMALAWPIFGPWNLMTFGSKLSGVVTEVHKRVFFGIGASALAALFFLVATDIAPDTLDENFSLLQPVLRSNFWLTIHVLTIVASYGAGMLALVMGIIGCCIYTFGSYRDPVVHTKTAEKLTGSAPMELTVASRRPPEECTTLGNYAYRCIQVAVLLLAAGTILGGFWADVSWGRFWGWDPKEVWALISLLVYLAVLHGRFAGWFNTFGLIAGTVLGGSMIIFSWYGVNFILPTFSESGSVGLHSYGTGAGGIEYVATFVALTYVALAAASVRYAFEMSPKITPKKVEN